MDGYEDSGKCKAILKYVNLHVGNNYIHIHRHTHIHKCIIYHKCSNHNYSSIERTNQLTTVNLTEYFIYAVRI